MGIICIRENPRHYVAFCRRLQAPGFCYFFDDLPGELQPIPSGDACNQAGVFESVDDLGKPCYRNAVDESVVDTRVMLLENLLALLDSPEKQQEFINVNRMVFKELSWEKVPDLCELYRLQP